MALRVTPTTLSPPALLLITALLLAALSSCTTVDSAYRSEESFSHTGRRRDRAPVAELTLSGDTFVFTAGHVPGLRVSGLVGDEDPPSRLYVTEARLFANWSNGWTEAFMEASGVLVLTRTDGGVTVTAQEPLELWSVTSGEIRYYDSYIIGEDGLRRVTARVDRLTALAQWLRDSGGPRYYGETLQQALDAELARGSDPLPEWLVPLIESGSLDRDVREAATMLRTIYNLDYLNGGALDAVILKER